MGWKSTKKISRQEAIDLIINHIYNASDSQISDALENLGFGDDSNLPHYGYNFDVSSYHDSNEEDDQ